MIGKFQEKMAFISKTLSEDGILKGKEIGFNILEILEENILGITETPKVENLTLEYKGAKGKDKKEDFGMVVIASVSTVPKYAMRLSKEFGIDLVEG